MKQAAIPGADILERGIEDIAAGRQSVDALLVEAAAPRLRFLGIDIPPIPSPQAGEHPDAELRLYALLGRQGNTDPYGEYNALLRRLASLCSALELARGRTLRAERALKHDGDLGSGKSRFE